MKSRKTIQLVKVCLHCDVCGGCMAETGVVLLSLPPKYAHKCPDCGVTVNCEKQCPYYEEEEEEE